MSGAVMVVFGFIVDGGVVVSVVLMTDAVDDGVVVSVVLCVGVDGGVSAGDETLVSRGWVMSGVAVGVLATVGLVV